jgi:hypothetical protein
LAVDGYSPLMVLARSWLIARCGNRVEYPSTALKLSACSLSLRRRGRLCPPPALPKITFNHAVQYF